MKPFVPRNAAWVYGKADGPFHPRGPAGGRCGTRNDGRGIGSLVSACRLTSGRSEAIADPLQRLARIVRASLLHCTN